MPKTIDCTLIIRGIRSTGQFELLFDEQKKPYIELGRNEDDKIVCFPLDEGEIKPDPSNRPTHLEYRKEIVVL